MSVYSLNNGFISISVNSQGAELSSIKNSEGTEFLWNADEKYWKRSSPVLFPIVGSLKNKEYVYNNKKYQMSQHGFARDMEFDIIFKNETAIFFELKSNEDTFKKYPFDFKLVIGYELKNNSVKFIWKVINTGNTEMLFSNRWTSSFYVPY